MSEKTDNYYKKMYLYSKQYHNNEYIKNKKDLIEFDIDFLIDTNREHYLTDSFLSYLWYYRRANLSVIWLFSNHFY